MYVVNTTTHFFKKSLDSKIPQFVWSIDVFNTKTDNITGDIVIIIKNNGNNTFEYKFNSLDWLIYREMTIGDLIQSSIDNLEELYNITRW